MFRNMIRCYGEELLAHHPTPKLEDHPLSAVRRQGMVHIGGRSSIRNLRTRHAVMVGTHLPLFNRFIYLRIRSAAKKIYLQLLNSLV